MVRACSAAAVTGEPTWITTGSARDPATSLMRLAIAIPAITVAQMSETSTILRWVVRSAVSSDELFILPSPGSYCPVSRSAPGEGSIAVADGELLRREQGDHPVPLVGHHDFFFYACG